MKFLTVLSKNAKKYPERIVFEDELYGTYNFSQIENYSSKIYSYLLDKKIGTEDIVVIRMKRSAKIIITMLGIWKAGASFVVIGEHSPEKYVNKVLLDAKNGLIFTDEDYEKCKSYPCKKGHFSVKKHDLSCLIYSTGSSGFFKGSMHEYGSIDEVIKKIGASNMLPLFLSNQEQTRNVMFYPLYSIDSIIEIILTIFFGNYYYIVPYSAIMDFSKLCIILNDKRIESICVASNNYRKLKQYSLPYLKRIDLSLDVNIDELNEDCEYSNAYALTEAFSWVTCSYIEKKHYDIIPSGKICPLTKVKICDNNKEVPKGQIGEIIVYNRYFRGYKNYPDLTEKVLHNGWISTGDIAYIDENDYFIVLGRKIDMIKTKNGYIIPMLISVQVKKHFPDITKSYVKLFQNGEKIKICIYYCGSSSHEISDFQNAFKGNLPDYMMPTHCVKMEDFKYFDFGKIDRLSFIEPD